MNDRLDELTLMYLDGRIAADELDELSAQLRDDAACRDRFCELTLRARLLREIKPVAGARDSEFKVHHTPPASVQKSNPAWRRRSIGFIAAAALIALALTAWFAPRSQSRNVSPEPVSIALLSDVHDAVFAVNQRAFVAGGPLDAGPIHLLTGKAQVMFNSAAVVDLIGPCEFNMTDVNHAALRRGRIEVYVPQAAVGFTVDLPDGYRAIDLGTEFAVEVDTINRLLVHVDRGRVLVESPTGEQRIIVAGQYLWRGETGLVVRDDDPLASPPPGATAYEFTESFDAPSLDTRRWRTLLPQADSQVFVSDSAATLINRGYLISRDHFAAGPDRVLRLSGVWEMSSGLDFMQILTRAVPEFSGQYAETAEGVEFRLSTNTPDKMPVAEILARGAIHLADVRSIAVPKSPNQRYRFAIEDRGDRAQFTIGPDLDDATPVTLSASIDPARQRARPIVIHNREGALSPGDRTRRTAQLHQIAIEYKSLSHTGAPANPTQPRQP